MSTRRATGLLLAGFVISLAGSGGARAEPEVLGLRVSGDVEVGGRVYIEKPSQQEEAKFEEYRDLPESAFGPYLFLRGDSKDDFYTVEIFGENIGQDDQKFQLTTYGVGRFNFQFLWDQIPHTFCTNCRTLLVENPGETFNLPTPRPSPLSVYNSAPLIDEIEFQTNTAAAGIVWTPTPDWEVGLEGSAIFRSGDRPLALPFGTPGNQAVEFAAPVENTTYGAHFNTGFSGKGYQLQLGFDYSQFSNDVNALRVDNPCFGLTAAFPTGCGTSGAFPAPATGQGSVAPSNSAYTFTLAGGVNLPFNTRLTGSFAYSLRFQDQDFLPFTINPTPGGTPAQQATLAQAQANLPSDLDGQVNILRFNLNTTSRIGPLTAGTWFRVYDYDDNSSEIPIAAYVEDDRQIVTALSERGALARRFPYTTWNAGGDLRYQVLPSLGIKVAFDWEQWVREANLLVLPPEAVEVGGDSELHVPREVHKTNTYTPKLMLDYNPLDWLLFRFGYTFSTRDGSEYLQATEDQFALLRKYDLADRDRNRFDFTADIMALDYLTLAVTFSYTMDDYGSTQYGLQDSNNWAAGMDATYRPLPWLSLFAGYVHEQWDTQSRQKFRSPTPTTAELNNPTYDWLSQTDDVYDTVRAGFNVTIIPNRLEGGANYNFSIGRTSMDASNPVTPVGPNAASAVAANFPEIQTTLNQVNAFLRYWITKNFYAKVMYSWEQWRQSDFRFDGLQPFNFPNPNTGDTIFLGMDPQNYNAQWFTLVLGYHF